MCICCTMCIAVFILDAGLLARSQYSEGPTTGHLDTGFSWFPCVYKPILRWFPRFQVATTCFSCSPPDLNLLVTNFIFCIHVKNHCHRVTTQLQLINIIIIINITYLPQLSCHSLAVVLTVVQTKQIRKNIAAISSNGLTNAWRCMCSFVLLMMDGKPVWSM